MVQDPGLPIFISHNTKNNRREFDGTPNPTSIYVILAPDFLS